MKHGTDVGLGPGHIVLDEDPAPPKGAQPPLPIFCPYLLWPNGWIDQDSRVTGQLADTPTRGLPTRGLDISRIGQLADWTTRGLADAAKRTKTKHAKSPVASASCPVRESSSPRVGVSASCPVTDSRCHLVRR